jgi:periplasmic protein TonB
MEPLAILRADPLDLLFENRNKSYGAYPLRKYYPQRLLISMGVTMSLVVAASFTFLYNNQNAGIISKPLVPDTVIEGILTEPPPKPIIPTTRQAALKPPATVPLSAPVIVADQQIPKPMPTVQDLENHAIGLTNSDGKPDSGDQPPNGNSLNAGTSKTDEPVENTTEVLKWAEVMPEFPGGLEALKRFLMKNLRMPENNLEEGTQVQVIARFVVGSDGRVRDIEITRAADAEFNQEVKRVISKMPDWKPGSQNHRNVAVYFSLPVNFVRAD